MQTSKVQLCKGSNQEVASKTDSSTFEDNYLNRVSFFFSCRFSLNLISVSMSWVF